MAQSPIMASPGSLFKDKIKLVIDSSDAINKYTLLDSYTLPRIDGTINKNAQHDVFNINKPLQCVSLSVLIFPFISHFSVFDACGKRFNFTRILFGVTYGITCFRRIMESSTGITGRDVCVFG